VIALLEQENERALRAHLTRHAAENGRGGDWFQPQAADDVALQAAIVPDAWTDDPARACGWQRAWGYCTPEGRVRGHASLTGSPLAVHRSTLAVGVELPFRRGGIAGELVEAACVWLRSQPTVDWADAFVFANNEAALRLLRASGFQELGRTPDALRWTAPNGVVYSTAQVQLTLRVAATVSLCVDRSTPFQSDSQAN
jgi:ribosomal protein S18 acetylase RimI-like enzyme